MEGRDQLSDFSKDPVTGALIRVKPREKSWIEKKIDVLEKRALKSEKQIKELRELMKLGGLL